MLEIFDAYSLKARLLPAFLAVLPCLTLFFISSIGGELGIPELLLTLATMSLFFAASVMSRRLGRKVEKVIVEQEGSRPRNTELMIDSAVFTSNQKRRYRKYLAEQIGLDEPNAEAEREGQEAAVQFHEEAFSWLRENTRDTSAYKILHNENIHYGYNRNLLGLKPLGITLNLITVVIAGALFYFSPDFLSLTNGKIIALLAISVAHLFYFLFEVNKERVVAASKMYSRQLVLSLDSLINAK